MKNECAREDDVHATTKPNHHLDLLLILHVGTHEVQEGFSADEDANGDESSMPSAEALEVTACFVLFAELLRARRRRVRANARCARRRMPEAVPRNLPCSSATCHSYRMLSARMTPPPPTRPSPCATRGRARAGARGDLERMLGPEARSAAPRAHRRASAWAAFRRRRRHEGRGAQGQTRSSLARISSLIAQVLVAES